MDSLRYTQPSQFQPAEKHSSPLCQQSVGEETRNPADNATARRRTNPLALEKADCHVCVQNQRRCDRQRRHCQTCENFGDICRGYPVHLMWPSTASVRGKSAGAHSMSRVSQSHPAASSQFGRQHALSSPAIGHYRFVEAKLRRRRKLHRNRAHTAQNPETETSNTQIWTQVSDEAVSQYHDQYPSQDQEPRSSNLLSSMDIFPDLDYSTATSMDLPAHSSTLDGWATMDPLATSNLLQDLDNDSSGVLLPDGNAMEEINSPAPFSRNRSVWQVGPNLLDGHPLVDRTTEQNEDQHEKHGDATLFVSDCQRNSAIQDPTSEPSIGHPTLQFSRAQDRFSCILSMCMSYRKKSLLYS